MTILAGGNRDEHMISLLTREKMLSGYRRDNTIREMIGVTSEKFKPQDISNGVVVAGARYFSKGSISREIQLVSDHSIASLWRVSSSNIHVVLDPESRNRTAGVDIANLVEMNSIHLSFNKAWQFCPDCIEEQREKYGYSYWRVTHQLPGMSRCLEHYKQLLTSDSLKILDKLELPLNVMSTRKIVKVKDVGQEWSEFIVRCFRDLQNSNISLPDMQRSIALHLELPSTLKPKNRKYIDQLLNKVEARLTERFLSYFFKHYEAFVYLGRKRPNFLWALLMHRSERCQHPIYTLIFLYFLELLPSEIHGLGIGKKDACIAVSK